jgi:hypothetical protein
MGETSSALLLIGVIVLILAAVAIFVGILVYMQRGQAKKQAQEEPPRPQPRLPESPVTDALEPAPPPVAAPPVETPASPGEVMRVVRDDRTGRVLVEVDGQRYTHIREIRDAQVGRRVLWAIADLVRFTGGMATNPQAVRSAAQERNGASFESASPALDAPTTVMPAEPPVPPAPPVTQPGTPAASTANGQPVQRTTGPDILPLAGASPAWTAGSTDASLAEQRRPSVLEFFRRGFQQPAAVEPAARPGSFIDEIEAILQQRIAGRGAPLPYDVHVKTGPQGKLQIEVGPNSYSSPEQIPDPEVRDLIKTAVAEWERR